MTWNPYESRPPKVGNDGSKAFYMKVGEDEFELEWQPGDFSDEQDCWIRPYRGDVFDIPLPEWFPSPYIRFTELIEPVTAYWLLENVKKAHERAFIMGKTEKANEIKKALGL